MEVTQGTGTRTVRAGEGEGGLCMLLIRGSLLLFLLLLATWFKEIGIFDMERCFRDFVALANPTQP